MFSLPDYMEIIVAIYSNHRMALSIFAFGIDLFGWLPATSGSFPKLNAIGSAITVYGIDVTATVQSQRPA